MSDIDNIIERALELRKRSKRSVLATVVETWGSAPRGVGAQLLVSEDGEMIGSVSGGCVEGAVVVEAMDCLETGKARLLEYGVADEDAFAVGLACGGRIRIWLEPVSAIGWDVVEEIAQARASRHPISYIFDVQSEERRLGKPEQDPSRFAADRSGFDQTSFKKIYNPPLRMMVIGAVHIAQFLLPMARLAGYEVTLIDPRPAFASAARFPAETIVEDWPDAALKALGLDARSCVITLTHDPKIDDPALATALHSNAFYIGALGSTRTHAKRVERLQQAGFASPTIERIHGPVGLPLGAAGPAEIAVSILSEVTKVLRSR